MFPSHDRIVKIVNNIREYAVMADIANKGKITIEPKALVVTTNVEQMHAGVTSNNPMSVLRRLHHHVELNVRDEFKTNNMLDSAKVVEKFGNLDQINDIWLVTLKKPVAAGSSGMNSQQFGSWEIVEEDLSIFQYLNILIQDVKKHVHHQKCITESFQEPSDLVDICPECNKISQTCKCDYSPQFGARVGAVIAENVNKLQMRDLITFADLVMSTIQKASGVTCTSDYVATLNEADKYDSNYRSYITGGIVTGKQM